MSILEAHHLHKTYRSKGKSLAAVRDVSLTLESKEVLAFLGANGAGKTTTIKMIAGLILPDQGQVRIAGRDPHTDSWALRSLGAVLEGSRNLYWRLTPEENLQYFGVLRGLTRKAARRRAMELLDRFELNHKRKAMVQTLSRGMQQKLAIAVALIHNPQLLLLDEPTLGLDVEATENVKQIIREVAAEGRAILLTTHQLDVAEELSDRVAIIQNGAIAVEQPTSALIRQFSGTAYTLELAQELEGDPGGICDAARLSKIEALGGVVKGNKVYVRELEMVYEALSILKPLPLVRVEQDQASLTDIFLQVIQSNT
jgi:ABC-2 type transport system ATP-binding protein